MSTKEKKSAVTEFQIDKVTGRFIGKLITYNGETLKVTEWAKRLGLSGSHLGNLITQHGVDYAFREWTRVTNAVHKHNGVARTMQQWADSLGVKYQAFMRRVSKHGLAAAIELGGPILKKIQTHNGVSMTFPQWAASIGVSYATFMKRLETMPFERALAMGGTPSTKKYTHGALSLTIKEWAAHLGVVESSFRKRLLQFGIAAAVEYKRKPPKPKAAPKRNGLAKRCKKGHAVEGDNVIIVRSRGRNDAKRCRQCYLANQRQFVAKRKKPRKLSLLCRAGIHAMRGENLAVDNMGRRRHCRACKRSRTLIVLSEKRRGVYVPRNTNGMGLSLEERLTFWIQPGKNGCELWSGPRGGRNRPIVYDSALDTRRALVRSLMWKRKNGSPLAADEALIMECGNEDCVASTHLVCVKRRERLIVTGAIEKRLLTMRLRHNPNSARYFEKIMEFRKDAYKAITKFHRIREDWDDIVQESMMAVYKKMLMDDNPILDVKAFLQMVARRKAVDAERHHVRVPHESLSNFHSFMSEESLETEELDIAAPANDNPLALIEREEEYRHARSRLLWRIRQLPGRQRQAVMLKAEGLTQKEVAAKMQISENTLEQHLQRAYAAIRGSRKMQSFSALYTGTDD